MTRHRLTTISFSLLSAGILTACSTDGRTAADTAAARADSAAGRLDSAATVTTDSARAMNTDASWTSARVFGYEHGAHAGEIALGKLAQQKATHAQVKAFARQVVTDHSAMMTQMHGLAGKLNASMDTTAEDARDLMSDGQEKLKELTEKEAGADWDKNYIESQIDDHKRVLEKLQDAAKGSTDAEMTAALAKSTAKVQEHLTKAENLKSTLLK